MQVIRARDFSAIERAAQASLDNAATLEALAKSARLGHTVVSGQQTPLDPTPTAVVRESGRWRKLGHVRRSG